MSESTGFTFTSAGLIPQTPTALYNQLITLATSLSPGLTSGLPGSLVSDVLGTDVGALTLCDQAAVETVASFAPLSANPWLLVLLAQIYLGQGSTANAPTNTAVFVVFSGTVGFPVQPGFLVSDGTNQYTVQDGGIVQTGGTTAPLFCLAVLPGSFAVPVNTVTTLVTSVPSGVSLTCTNPLAGTPGGVGETQGQFRARVVESGLATAQGVPNFVKATLGAVSGVNAQLISVRSPSAGQWEVIVGGTGDPYAIAYAIYQSIPDISELVGSTLAVTNFTAANPGVVTTNLNHGFTTGQVVSIENVTPSTYDNAAYTITVLTEKTFSVGVNSSGFGAYVSGGVVTPNFRNQVVSINDYPDTYSVPFVVSPAQTVGMTVTWNTLATNYVSPLGVAQLAQQPLADYVNGLGVGQPMNEFEMNTVFVNAISGIVDPTLIDRIVFSIQINGITTAPGSGTGAVFGDPESYFSCAVSAITVIQG